MTPEDRVALEIVKVTFEHLGILWPKNHQEHTGELIERLRPILIAYAAAQRERDARLLEGYYVEDGTLFSSTQNAIARHLAALIRTQSEQRFDERL